MNPLKIKGNLETSTNIAVLLVALVFLVTVTQKFLSTGLPEIQVSDGLKTGLRLPVVPNINFADSPSTVVIAMSTHCRFCTESISFYKKIAASQRTQFPGSRVIAIFPEAAQDVRLYMQQNQLDIQSVPAVDLAALNVAGTPTVMFVDNAGKVVNFWTGKLTPEAERLVLNTMS